LFFNNLTITLIAHKNKNKTICIWADFTMNTNALQHNNKKRETPKQRFAKGFLESEVIEKKRYTIRI